MSEPHRAENLRRSSKLQILPRKALAATVAGLPSHTGPGPLRPGKLRLKAPMVTWPGRVEIPGPAWMQAPHPGLTTRAPAASKSASQPCASAWQAHVLAAQLDEQLHLERHA